MTQNTHHPSDISDIQENPLFWQAFAALMRNDTITADALIEEGILGMGDTTNSGESLYGKNCTTTIRAVHDQIQLDHDVKPSRDLTLSQQEICCLLRLYAIESAITIHRKRCTPAAFAHLTNRIHRAVHFFNCYASL